MRFKLFLSAGALLLLSAAAAVDDVVEEQSDEEKYAAQLQQLAEEDGSTMITFTRIYEGGILNLTDRLSDEAVLAKIPGLSGTDGAAAIKAYVDCCDDCRSPDSGTPKCNADDGCGTLSANNAKTCKSCAVCVDRCKASKFPEDTLGLIEYYESERASDTEVEEEPTKDEHPQWQTWLLIVGFFAFMLAGIWLYWRSSELYQVRKQQKKLGYEVPTLLSYVSWCCVCCIGPMVRRKWNRKNRFFRTEDYGDEMQPWLGKYMNPKRGKWGKLPRGDHAVFKKRTQAVLAKVQGKIMNELLQSAIKRALEHYEKDAKKKKEAREGMEKMRRHTQAYNFTDDDIERMRQEELARLEIEAEQKNLEDSGSDESDDPAEEWGGVMETGFGPGGASAHRAAATATAAAVVERNPSKVSFAESSDMVVAEHSAAPRSGTTLNLMSLRKKTHSMTPDTIISEFKRIPNKPFPPSKLPNEIKQFTRNLKFIPIPQTAVQVNPKENEANTRYINASYIPGPSGEPKRYIVTQAPQSGRHSAQGKGKTIDAFWSMVYAHRSSVIVMIEGSQPYVPEGEPGTTSVYHKIKVILRSVEKRSHWIKTTVELQHSRVAGSSRIVHHFNFTGWPRNAASPASTAPIMQLMDQAMQQLEENPDAPIVIQDLCGGGKAGTYIAIEYAMQALDESVTDDPNTTRVDVAGVVRRLRESRPGMVAFPAEYVFLHKVVTMYSLELDLPSPPAYVEAPPE